MTEDEYMEGFIEENPKNKKHHNKEIYIFRQCEKLKSKLQASIIKPNCRCGIWTTSLQKTTMDLPDYCFQK